MAVTAKLLVALVAVLHIYIMLLEVLWWDKPQGQRAFNLTADFAGKTKVLAANQGVYNGFLAAGLIWGIIYPVAEFGWQIQLFFLACVAIAGIVGALTSSRKILLVQTVPAVIAAIAVLLAI